MKRLSITVLFLVLSFLSGQRLLAQNAHDLFQKALVAERTHGDLERAIELYRQIIGNHEDDRGLAAKALLQMGQCYEKLGNTEAKKAYGRIVEEYADQTAISAQARTRLAALISSGNHDKPLQPRFTRVEIASNPRNGVLSPDGTRLATFSEGSVWIIPLHGNVNPDIAGEPIRIAKVPNAWDSSSLMSWSSDGNWIAVNGEDTEEGMLAYIIPATEGKYQTTQIPKRGGHSYSYRLSLSPDGQTLAFSALDPGIEKPGLHPHDRRVFTVPLAGGESKQISLSGAWAGLPSFSNDGKFIAYVGYSEGNIGELWIAPSVGGNPVKVASVNGRLRGPIWSPDNRYIAAHYEPGGSNSSKEILVYALSSDLSTAAEATRITLPGESLNLLSGWTPDNELGLFIRSEQHSAIYTVPATGGKAVQVSPDKQWPYYYPRWSPDGKRIYFRPTSQQTPEYVPATGGNPIGIPVASNRDLTCRVPGGGFNISPDGKKIVISGGGGKERYSDEGNLLTIALDNGMPTRLPSDRYFSCRCPCWSPDGKWIAFRDSTGTQDKNYVEGFQAIYVIPAEGGTIRQITSKADNVGRGAVTFSPNGEHIAFFSDSAIKTIPVEGGQSEILVSEIKSSDYSQLAYSPDGTKIAHNAYGKIWITPLDEGIPHELQTGLDKSVRLSGFSWSPDGEKIAFVCSSGGEAEFHLISDFLPPDKLAQENKPEGISIRQISKAPYLDNLGTVSSDGKYLSCVDWETGDLAIRNLLRNEKYPLTDSAKQGKNPDKFVMGSAISKNGKLVAYSWWRPFHTFDLHVFDVEKKSSRLIYKEEGVETYPLAWLSDNKLIVLRQNRNDDTSHISSFDVSDGTFDNLKSINQRQWLPLCTDPGEQYIAYSLAPNGSDNSDIYMLTADGESETPLVVHPANDKVIGWFPNRRDFLFISDRSGAWDLWALPMANGKATGEAKRLYTEIGEVEPIGITESGDCFFGFSKRNFNAYTIPVNATTGKPDQKRGTPLAGSLLRINWSPDGQYIACVKQGRGSLELVVRDTASGEERRLAKELVAALEPRWSGDAKSIYVFGVDQKRYRTKGYKGGIYTVDLETGIARENLATADYEYTPTDDDALPISGHAVSADEQYLYLLFQNDWIVKHDLNAGKDTILFRHPKFRQGILQLSPDGERLLFAVQNKGEETSHLMTIPTHGGDEREICTAQIIGRAGSAFWSPDGKSIYFRETTEGTNLWRVNAEGGKPEKVWHTDKKAEGFTIHPMGTEISYTVRERTTEIRVIENLGKELSKVHDQSD